MVDTVNRRPLPPHVVSKVVALHQAGHGPIAIMAVLRQEGLSVSRSSVWRHTVAPPKPPRPASRLRAVRRGRPPRPRLSRIVPLTEPAPAPAPALPPSSGLVAAVGIPVASRGPLAWRLLAAHAIAQGALPQRPCFDHTGRWMEWFASARAAVLVWVQTPEVLPDGTLSSVVNVPRPSPLARRVPLALMVPMLETGEVRIVLVPAGATSVVHSAADTWRWDRAVPDTDSRAPSRREWGAVARAYAALWSHAPLAGECDMLARLPQASAG